MRPFSQFCSGLTAAIVFGMALQASAVSFVLKPGDASLTSGNTKSTFYDVSGKGVEDAGTAAGSLFSTAVGGNANTGYFVEISFGGQPQPVLTSAFLKASNKYLWWDETDLAAFNAGTFDSIRIYNSGGLGIKNWLGKFQETSHAGIGGNLKQTTQPETGVVTGTDIGTPIPDGGSTLLLLGAGMVMLGAIRRRS